MSVGEKQIANAASNIGNVPNSQFANDETIVAATWRQRAQMGLRTWWPFYLMLLPGILYFAVFHYFPIYQAKLAFEEFRIIGANVWVGFKHFSALSASPVFVQVMFNTLIISAMKIAFVFPVPIFVALLINEVRSSGARKFIQSAIYLPHFLSWVVIAGIFIAALSPSDGVVNEMRGWVGLSPVAFMTDSGAIRWVVVFSEMWRSAGWDSLLYFAAIMAIDPQLYDAAEMDGANRWQKILFVTIPGIVPTIATLFILNVGLFMSAGFDQVFNLSNDAIRDQIDIIDTYVYRVGLQSGQFALATAAGLFKGVIGMILIVAAHTLSKRLTGKGVW